MTKPNCTYITRASSGAQNASPHTNPALTKLPDKTEEASSKLSTSPSSSPKPSPVPSMTSTRISSDFPGSGVKIGRPAQPTNANNQENTNAKLQEPAISLRAHLKYKQQTEATIATYTNQKRIVEGRLNKVIQQRDELDKAGVAKDQQLDIIRSDIECLKESVDMITRRNKELEEENRKLLQLTTQKDDIIRSHVQEIKQLETDRDQAINNEIALRYPSKNSKRKIEDTQTVYRVD